MRNVVHRRVAFGVVLFLSIAVSASPEAGQPLQTWEQIDRLIRDQKQQAALDAVLARLARAQTSNDEPDWTKSILRASALQTALGGYEKAVKFLQQTPRPSGVLSSTAVLLHYAQTLFTYADEYGYEIRQREKVGETKPAELRDWTLEQILTEAMAALDLAWKNRVSLGSQVPAQLQGLEPNDYPKQIRGTLRDAVTYLRAEQLANSAHWTPAQSDALPKRFSPGSKDLHPLSLMVNSLDDLEKWHQSAGRVEAALEARRVKIELLSAHVQGPPRAELRTELEKRLAGLERFGWWTMGMSTLAELYSQEALFVDAHRIAQKCASGDSVGAQRCRHTLATLEMPSFRLRAMRIDGPGRRSLEVTHRNLKTLYFRAYRLDVSEFALQSPQAPLSPTQEALQRLIRTPPVAEWNAAIPNLGDFKEHRTFVTPPLDKRGFYAVVASAEKGFSQGHITAITMFISDLVVVFSEGSGPRVEVVSGDTGQPISGVELSLYSRDWKSLPKKESTATTNAQGTATLGALGYKSYFLIARKGDDTVTVENVSRGYGSDGKWTDYKSAFIYTDRSTYRPGQKLLWKVVTYRSTGENSFKTSPHTSLKITLRDPNGEAAAELETKTNGFGSAAGELIIPSGRPLGQWNLSSDSHPGDAAIRVEEYKRPTFEATFSDSEAPLRLGRAAVVKGQARYYFGQPLSAGTVRWRVNVEPLYPWWWARWTGLPLQSAAQLVASGNGALDAEGKFTFSFTPKPQEPTNEHTRHVLYRYRLTADITDEAGETRTATQVTTVGFSSIAATVTLDHGFTLAGTGTTAKLSRRNLDGIARPGRGTYRVVVLDPPAQVLLPADQPLPAGQGPTTPGDLLSPRWESARDPLESLADWKPGEEKVRGSVEHNAQGEAQLAVPALPAGAYRILYETQDEEGATASAFRDFFVAGKAEALKLPLALAAESHTVGVGETVRLYVGSALPGQKLWLEVSRKGRRVQRELWTPSSGTIFEWKVTDQDRGGLSFQVFTVRDYQALSSSRTVFVPWDNKSLAVSFETFRDKIRPGTTETWRIKVKSTDGSPVETKSAEVLAYMFDQSLDLFGAHTPPHPLGIYRTYGPSSQPLAQLGPAYEIQVAPESASLPPYPSLRSDQLSLIRRYGVGGPGGRKLHRFAEGVAAMSLDAAQPLSKSKDSTLASGAPPTPPAASPALRTDFSETAFWKPQLILNKDGTVQFEFKVPDSVTSWHVWVHALTQDLRSGALNRQTRSAKELLVRPYLPRFLRAGDEATLKVAVNNESDRALEGEVRLEILDAQTQANVLQELGVTSSIRPFSAAAGKGTAVSYTLRAPNRVRNLQVKVVAQSSAFSDGELRALPLLPSRMQLMQSRFAVLKDTAHRELTFDDLRSEERSRINEQMVVTLDGQLFYSVLDALPYLIEYPYDCTEQILNRYVSAGMLASLFNRHPAVAKMAKSLSGRKTPLAPFDTADANRKMALEETPWKVESSGGTASSPVLNLLDPANASTLRDSALMQLRNAQTSDGAFPWFPGGPPSPYITLYILYGLSKAAEHGVAVPQDITQSVWRYMSQHVRERYLKTLVKDDCCWEFLTFLNYVASNFPNEKDLGEGLTREERATLLQHSVKHWREHSPYLKGMLALTLQRSGDAKTARQVFDSVMDSAKTAPDQGTFWMPEERSWLWYNDNIEGHTMALQVLLEINPRDPRLDGLVTWLMLNKKLNHWKSTKATAEVIHALVKYMNQTGQMGAREIIQVAAGPVKKELVFEPDQYTGAKNQVVVPGPQVGKSTATVSVSKATRGLAFASATWHFSTEKLPSEDRGDFFQVSRKLFKRSLRGKEAELTPLENGASLAVGEQVEVHLLLRTKHEAEYVHLRDPRAAGLEPEEAVSGYRWDLGMARYEETRDSGTHFFFEKLPVGEYTFKYRIRANMAGTFRIAPAQVQSVYAPDFVAYSKGDVLRINEASATTGQ